MTPFFTEFTCIKGLLYSCAIIYVVFTAIAVCTEPFITLPCDYDFTSTQGLKFGNVFFHHNPCLSETRYLRLMGLTPMECTFGRHMVMAVVLGSIIGYERREADRPAGIRTMALVSLAASLFTINSVFAFMIGPFHWDPARVSAAIPSGVGFLGAGLIVKDSEKDPVTREKHHTVKGINTAASTWLSAAVGVACGGGLYFLASYTAALMLCLLRFGPRQLQREGSVLGLLPQTEEDVKKFDRKDTDSKGSVQEMSFRKSKLVKPSLNYD